MCYIGTYPVGPQREGSRQNNRRSYWVSPYADDVWNYREGQTVRVVCYTNGTDARLLLNGQPVAQTAQYDEATGIRYWDVEYAAGTLRCEADNGASYEITTTKAPVALRVTTDSVAHVFIEVVDEDGRLVKGADNEVTLMVRGARLLGMENGNIMDTSVAGRQQRSANRLRVHNGRLVAYIEPLAKTSEITIHAHSPFLKSAQLQLSSK
jgi:hypothetical protein